MALRAESRIQAEGSLRLLVVGYRWNRVLALIGFHIFICGMACIFAANSDFAKSQADSADTPSKSTAPLYWDNGFHIRSRSGEAQLEVGGTLQVDGRLFVGDQVPRSIPDFILRRGRLVFLGTALKRLGFRFTVESQKDGPMVLRDAYLDLGVHEGIHVTVGKLKSPIGLERLQSPRYLTFTERSLLTNLIPDRDLGIMLHGDLLANRFTYMGGLFRGVPDGGSSETSTNHGADGEFRVFTYPFRRVSTSLLEGLGFGIGGSAGNERGTLPSFTTAGLARFFSYRPGAVADGERTRISPQADYYRRRLGLMAEYALSAQDVRLGDVFRRVSNAAWETTASFVLTGENASYNGVTPAHTLNPANHHWGAFEVAGRLNSLRVDPNAFPLLADPTTAARKASGFSAGLNWYPQKYFKIMFNYAQTRFVGGASAGNRPTEKALIVLFQFSCY